MKCWMPDYEEEDEAISLADADDEESAASEACEWWNSMGRWSGDPMPDEIEVYVRGPVGLVVVDVVPAYDVHFRDTATRPVKP